jgi:hypothetical protein
MEKVKINFFLNFKNIFLIFVKNQITSLLAVKVVRITDRTAVNSVEKALK